MSRPSSPIHRHWHGIAARHLVGRTNVSVAYMNPSEAADCGWHNRALVLVLDNGHALWAASDDEGNDAGALFTSFEDAPVLPALPAKRGQS